MTINEFLSVISVAVALLPVCFRIFILIGQKSHNQKLRNLAERSEIIVTALEQSGMTNEDKKTAALQKLAIYAKEVGIKVTPQQLDDYIESAVVFVKTLVK